MEWFCFLTVWDVKIFPIVSGIFFIPNPGTSGTLIVCFFQFDFPYLCGGYGKQVELFEGGIIPTELICRAPWLEIFM